MGCKGRPAGPAAKVNERAIRILASQTAQRVYSLISEKAKASLLGRARFLLGLQNSGETKTAVQMGTPAWRSDRAGVV